MRILLAVSGGIDSMYLLHRAPELFPGASFAVAHCNFALRGKDSDDDEDFVRSACADLGIECFVKRFDTLAFAALQGISVEMAARELRYAWFSELCDTEGFDSLATAHNANDNAETLILNLLRGTGSKGLRGINSSKPFGTTIPLHPQGTEGVSPDLLCVGPKGLLSATGQSAAASNRRLEVYRPLLGISREEIRKWMMTNGFKWQEDKTNAENGPKRNKIRNQVFPVFKEINPSFVKTLCADMERFRQTDDIAEDYFREASERIVRQNGPATEINVPCLLALKHWRYVLWRILEGFSFSAATFDKLCTLLDRYRSEPSGTVTLSGKTFQSPTAILRARKKTLILIPR